MPVKELNAVYKGKRLRVHNTWFSGATLFVDDDNVASSDALFAVDGNTPVFSSQYDFGDGDEIIDVCVKAIFTTKIQIHVGGEALAGETF